MKQISALALIITALFGVLLAPHAPSAVAPAQTSGSTRGFPAYPLQTPAGLISAVRGGLSPIVTKTTAKQRFAGPAGNARTADIFSISGSGTVTEIELIVANVSAIYDCQIEIFVDGQANGSAGLIMPYGLLCGFEADNELNTASAAYVISAAALKYGNQKFSTPNFEVEYSVYNTQLGTNSACTKILFRFPIPFSNGIRMALWNPTASDLSGSTTFWCQAAYTPTVTSQLRLKCKGNPAFVNNASAAGRVASLATSADGTLFTLAAGNSGWLVAHWLDEKSAANDTTGNTIFERDIWFSRDQEGTASVKSTGTEDWFDSSNYWGGQNYQQSSNNAYASMVRLGGATFGNALAHLSAFKDLLAAYGGLRYANGCTMILDHTGDTILSNSEFWSTALYYQIGN